MDINKKIIYNTHETAAILGITPQTLRNWDEKNILKPTYTTTGGHRRYSQKDIKRFLDTYGGKQ